MDSAPVEVELLGVARLLARRETVSLPLGPRGTAGELLAALAVEAPPLVGTVLAEDGALLGGHVLCRGGTELLTEPSAQIHPGELLYLLSTAAGGTSSVPDLPYSEYVARCRAKLDEAPTDCVSRRYRFYSRGPSQADVRAEPVPGITLLAEPYPIGDPDTRRGLETLQTGLARVPGFVPVPADSLHMTAGDLLSSRAFEDAPPDVIGQVQDRLATLFAGWEWHPLQGRVLGATTFTSGVVVAVVGFSEEDYGALIGLRRAVYDCLQGLAPPPEHPLLAHVTLGYLAAPSDPELGRVLRLYRSVREPWTFPIRSVGLFSFADMNAFTPLGPRVGP